MPELNLLLGGVGVESVLQGLAVDDTVDDARGEGRVPDDLCFVSWAIAFGRGGVPRRRRCKRVIKGEGEENASVTSFSLMVLYRN